MARPVPHKEMKDGALKKMADKQDSIQQAQNKSLLCFHYANLRMWAGTFVAILPPEKEK